MKASSAVTAPSAIWKVATNSNSFDWLKKVATDFRPITTLAAAFHVKLYRKQLGVLWLVEKNGTSFYRLQHAAFVEIKGDDVLRWRTYNKCNALRGGPSPALVWKLLPQIKLNALVQYLFTNGNPLLRMLSCIIRASYNLICGKDLKLGRP